MIGTHPRTIEMEADAPATQTICKTCKQHRAPFEMLVVKDVPDLLLPGDVICTACANEAARADTVKRAAIKAALPPQDESGLLSAISPPTLGKDAT